MYPLIAHLVYHYHGRVRMNSSYTLDCAVDEQRAHAKANAMVKQSIGATHYMRPSSVVKLLNAIGIDNIRNQRILEAGCGTGFLVAHLIRAGASHVIATEINDHAITCFPTCRFKDSQLSLQKESFLNTDIMLEVNVVTQIIGIPELIDKLLHMFLVNPHVKVVAFVKPRRTSDIQEKYRSLLDDASVLKTSVDIKLSGSNNGRTVVVLRRLNRKRPREPDTENLEKPAIVSF